MARATSWPQSLEADAFAIRPNTHPSQRDISRGESKERGYVIPFSRHTLSFKGGLTRRIVGGDGGAPFDIACGEEQSHDHLKLVEGRGALQHTPDAPQCDGFHPCHSLTRDTPRAVTFELSLNNQGHRGVAHAPRNTMSRTASLVSSHRAHERNHLDCSSSTVRCMTHLIARCVA